MHGLQKTESLGKVVELGGVVVHIYHTSLKMSPFMALYGCPPSLIVEQARTKTRLAGLEEWMEEKQEMNRFLREQLLGARIG